MRTLPALLLVSLVSFTAHARDWRGCRAHAVDAAGCGVARSADGAFTLLSLNVYAPSCITQASERFSCIGRCVGALDVDVVALQEMTDPASDEVIAFARKTHAPLRPGSATRRVGGAGDTGIELLVRSPRAPASTLVHVERFAMQSGCDGALALCQTKGFAIADVTVRDGCPSVSVVSVHLGLDDGVAAQQWQRVCAALREHGRTRRVIVMGDFNFTTFGVAAGQTAVCSAGDRSITFRDVRSTTSTATHGRSATGFDPWSVLFEPAHEWIDHALVSQDIADGAVVDVVLDAPLHGVSASDHLGLLLRVPAACRE